MEIAVWWEKGVFFFVGQASHCFSSAGLCIDLLRNIFTGPAAAVAKCTVPGHQKLWQLYQLS